MSFAHDLLKRGRMFQIGVFFQLVTNIQNFALKSDGFYIEDNEAIKEIENYLRGY